MEELLATVILHGSAGEFGRISAFLTDASQNGNFSADVRTLLQATLYLRSDEVKAGMDILRQHTSGKLATIALFIEFLYLNSCPLKDSDRIEILQRSLELDFVTVSLPMMLTIITVAVFFSTGLLLPFLNRIENDSDGIAACCAIAILMADNPAPKYLEQLDKYMHPCLKSFKSPIVSLANIFFYLRFDTSILKDYLPAVTSRYARFGSALRDLQTLALFDPSAFASSIEVYQANLAPGMTLIDNIQQTHFPFSHINQLSVLLSIACFNTEADLNSTLYTIGKQVISRDIGNIRSPQQLSAVCGFMVGMLRSCPLISVCDTLMDLLTEILADTKLQRTYKTPLQILQAYFSSAKALLQYTNNSVEAARDSANLALENMKKIMERMDGSLAEVSIVGINTKSMLLTIEDMHILMIALSGKLDKAISKAHMLTELDIDMGLTELDAPASPSKLLIQESTSNNPQHPRVIHPSVRKHSVMNFLLSSMGSSPLDHKPILLIIKNILPSLISMAKHPLDNMIGSGLLCNNVRYCDLFPDTLSLSLMSKYMIQTLKMGHGSSLTDDEAKILNAAYGILHSLIVSSANLRLTDLHLLATLQEHQVLIKRVYTLSSFASEHGFIGLTTDEFFLAAASSNAIGNNKEVQIFLSQAILLDPTIEQTSDFASVVSKIYAARGDWNQAIKSLSTILNGKIIALKDDSLTNPELLPIRVHIALLKLRFSDASGYHDLKSYFAALENDISAKGKRLNPLAIELDNANIDYVHMQLSYLISKIIIFCLINACIVQLSNITNISDNLLTTLCSDYSLLFFENSGITAEVMNALTGNTKQTDNHASSITNKFPYFGIEYGSDPFPLNEIFTPPDATNMCFSMAKSLVTSDSMSVQKAIALIKPYTKITREIDGFLGLISLHIKGDKSAYIHAFLLDSSLDKGPSYETASPSQLLSLASAYQFVGNVKDSSRCLEAMMNNQKKYVKAFSFTPSSALLFRNLLLTLYTRSLCKVHHFLKAETLLVEAVNTLLKGWNKDVDGYPLAYTLVYVELVRLLYRMKKEADIAQLSEATIATLKVQYNLPQNPEVPANHLPVDAVYLAVYAIRYRLALKDPLPTNDEKIERLRLATNWFTSCIIVKTSKLFTNTIKPKVLISDGIFSSGESLIHNAAIYQNTQVSSSMIACKANVIGAELYLDLASAYLEPTGITLDQILQPDISLDPIKKAMAKDALNLIKLSLDLCETAKAYLMGAIIFSVVALDYVTANEYINHALELPAANNLAEEFHTQLKSKLADNDYNDTDNFNLDFHGFVEPTEDIELAPKTPFEQVVYKLKKDLTCNRADVLDSFLIQSCSRRDPWNFYNLLFGSENNIEPLDLVYVDQDNATPVTSEESYGSAGDNDGMPDLIRASQEDDHRSKMRETALHDSHPSMNASMVTQIADKNLQSTQLLDGYWFLGIGLICIRTGRVKDGVPYLIAATKTHTLQETYKARAYFILGTTYLNSNRAPLFGYQSALTTKSTTAVAMQKMAMKLSKSATNTEEDQFLDAADGTIPDLATIETCENNLHNAIKNLKELDKLASRGITEASVLHLALSCYAKVTEYKNVKDKIAAIMLDEGKGARSKLVPLESRKDKLKDDLELAKEDLLAALEDMNDLSPNIVVLLTCLGVVFTHLKNHPRARNQFKRATSLITDIKDLSTSGQLSRWLDLDAAVSANLALADLYVTAGKLSNAIKSLEAISHLDLLNAISYELYGLIMEKEASYNDACKYYESAWLLSRGASTVAFRLAYNYIKSNRYEDAIVMCQLALREWPDFNKLRKEVLYLAERRLRTSSI